MERCWGFWLFISASFFTTVSAYAYTPSVTSGGIPVLWPQNPKLNLAGNPKNRSGLSDDEVEASVVRGLQRWKKASGGRMDFDYWQGSDSSVFLPNSDYNGLSSVYFASNVTTGRLPNLSGSVLGLTQVWYDAKSGEILEADIVLNDIDFKFTTNEKDTSGFGAPQTGETVGLGATPAVFIENVLTHEIGHALGLSHSGGLQSTMLYMESPEQAHLGCDEEVAIRALYPADDSSQRGRITGKAFSPDGSPLFGAQVSAVSRRRGVAIATSMVDKSGNYAIEALEPGSYSILIEPFLEGSQSLPDYYTGSDPFVCAGRTAFRRTFLADSVGKLTSLVVSPGAATTEAPDLVANCGQAISTSVGANAMATAPVIFSPLAGDPTGFSYVDSFRSSDKSQESPESGESGAATTLFYKLQGISGHLEIHALSYSLFSPIHADLALLDSAGNVVFKATPSVYLGDSGYVNFDTAINANGLAEGDYTVRLTASLVDYWDYPMGEMLVDENPFFLLTGSLNEPEPSLKESLPVNARCRMLEKFPTYSQPAGSPPRLSIDGQDSGGGFCSTVNSERPKPPFGAARVIAWFLPWLMMAGYVRLLRRRLAAANLRA
jgi:hypothetical protein